MSRKTILRPTQNKVKQAIFNIFQNEIINSEFLDLFAGTGQIGIEALNHGAKNIVLVENNPVLIKKLNEINADKKIEIVKKDVFFAIGNFYRQNKKFDFVFADPPYHENLYDKILTELEKHDILNTQGRLILEHYWRENLPEETPVFKVWQKKKYGDTVLTIYKKKAV
ncbi:MAG: 16S rRNA (guanine(966)-N(2))-methyltransferase RsmD [bacterium]